MTNTDLTFENVAWTYEEVTDAPGGIGYARFIGSHVDNVVYLVACSAFGAAWSWPEVAEIASLQALRIASRIESN